MSDKCLIFGFACGVYRVPVRRARPRSIDVEFDQPKPAHLRPSSTLHSGGANKHHRGPQRPSGARGANETLTSETDVSRSGNVGILLYLSGGHGTNYSRQDDGIVKEGNRTNQPTFPRHFEASTSLSSGGADAQLRSLLKVWRGSCSPVLGLSGLDRGAGCPLRSTAGARSADLNSQSSVDLDAALAGGSRRLSFVEEKMK